MATRPLLARATRLSSPLASLCCSSCRWDRWRTRQQTARLLLHLRLFSHSSHPTLSQAATPAPTASHTQAAHSAGRYDHSPDSLAAAHPPAFQAGLPPPASPLPPSSPIVSLSASPPPPPPRPPPRSSLLRSVLTAAALASVLYAYHSSSSAATSSPLSCVSCSEDELLDLLSRARLTSADLIALYARCMRRHQLGLLTLEQFARLAEEQAEEARQRRREARQRREADRLQAQQAVAGESESAAASASASASASADAGASTGASASAGVDELGSYWDEQEAQEEKDAVELFSGASASDERRDKELRDSMRRASFSWWELLALFRTVQPVIGQQYDIRDLMVGVAQLAYDHEAWKSVAERRATERQRSEAGGSSGTEKASTADSKLSRSRRLMLCYQPWKKLEVAWRVSQPQGAGDTMTYEEVRRLVGRMLRTGHFTANSLVRGVSQSALQPRHVQMDAEAVTYLLFQQLHADSRWRGQPTGSDIDSDVFLTHDATLTAAPQQATSDFEERLTATPTAHSAPFMHRLGPFAPSALVEQPPCARCVTSAPTIPAASSLSYSQLLSVCRSLTCRGQLQLWYGVSRDAASGERAGPIKRRRMALQERLAHNAHKLCTAQQTRSTVEWLP